jgi:hypothetical protein
MAATDGYAIIRNVIPADLAHQAAASIPGTLKVRVEYDGLIEYDPQNHDDDPQNCGKPKSPSFGDRIRDYFVKVNPTPIQRLSITLTFPAKKGDKTDLLQLLNRASGEKLVLTSVGVFHQPKAKPTEIKRGLEGTVYVTIAVTKLNAEDGWFTFLKGSHRGTPFTDWVRVDLQMNAGDAVVWSGDLRYINSSEGGGKFVTLTYQ